VSDDPDRVAPAQAGRPPAWPGRMVLMGRSEVLYLDLNQIFP